MSNIIVKADTRAMKLWLIRIINDKAKSIDDRWMAKQILDSING